ncbi:hypothetical protein A2U01_0112115, partial [Trifolium medium]|nr:hypothetical protein [Trifolium medium]
LPHQQYCGRNCGCGPQFKTLNCVEKGTKHLIHVKWSAPPEGWISLNSDGSCQDGLDVVEFCEEVKENG